MIRTRRKEYTAIAIVMAIGVAVLAQAYISSVHAASTITGTDNQIITIKTTDSLPINASYGVMGYSGDGNVILFTSSATNLPDVSTAPLGLYVYNIKQDITQRVDISTAGVPANKAPLTGQGGNSYRISETGRYVTFSSFADNLRDGMTYPYPSYYQRDVQAATTTYMVGTTAATKSGADVDFNLDVSNDGRFAIVASRYINGTYPYPYKLNLGDNISGSYTWTALPLSSGGPGQGDYTSYGRAGVMSCDGSFIAYNANSSEVALLDIRRGSNTLLTSGFNTSQIAAISCNGRYVIYSTTNRTDITPTPTGMNANYHLVRYDRITGERIYIDSDSSGVFGSGRPVGSFAVNHFRASVSDSGDVVFQQGSYTYLKHLSDDSGTLEAIAKNTSGTAINIAYGEITRNGRYIFFQTDPYNLGLAPSASTSQIIRTKTNL